MSKRRTPANPVPRPKAPEPSPRIDRSGFIRGFVMVASTALLLVRWLIPTESAGGEPVTLGDSRLLTETQLITVGWFVIAGIWVIGERKRDWNLGWVDATVWMLTGGHILSALGVLFSEGDKRAALNLAWEWLGLGVSFTLLRQLLVDIPYRRGLVTVLVAASIVLAGFGVWQCYVWYPQRIAEYNPLRAELDALENAGKPADANGAARWESNRERVVRQLEQLGISREWLQGTARALFESRLRDSSEPFGKFALANNFGGLLMCWLIVLAAQMIHAFREGELGWGTLALLITSAGLMGFCLLLTKSRTAFLGLIAGLSVFAWSQFRATQSQNARRLGIGIAACVIGLGILTGIAYASGGLDRFVLSESLKSLTYRLQYWQGSWDVILEHPVLGVGPGNFRQHYLAHKLPESSEEIVDPHNLLLEAWANGGILAFLGLSLLVVLVFGRILLGEYSKSREAADGESEPASSAGETCSILGGSLAFLSVIIVTLTLDESLIVLGVGWGILVAMFFRWNGVTILEPAVWQAAAIGLVVHMLGAHGIGMAAISQALLLCVALGTTTSDPARVRSFAVPLSVKYGVAAALFLAALQCYLMVTRPTFIRDAWLQEANFATTRRFRDQALVEAGAADPLSDQVFRTLFALASQDWKETGKEDAFESAKAAVEVVIARNPLSDTGYRMLGQLWQSRFEKTHAPQDALQAAKAYTLAVKRYPYAADLLKDLALAWAAADQPEKATESAKAALKQNLINHEEGHRDKFLPDDVVSQLQKLADENTDEAKS